MRCLLPLLLFPALLHAQSRSVTSGKVAYMSQDYEQAWTQLNRALEEPDQLEERHLVDAHHYRAMTALRLFVAEGERDRDAVLDRSLEDFAWFHEHAPAALETPAVGLAMDDVYRINLYRALEAFNDGDATGALRRLRPLEPGGRDQPGYLDLVAQCLMETGAVEEADRFFADAIAVYARQPPDEPDPYIGYAFYRRALLARYHLPAYRDARGQTTPEGLERALDAVDRGLAWVAGENARAPRENLAERFDGLRDDLSTFRLDLLLNLPDRLDEALAAFEAAVAAHPERIPLRLGRASLLENAGRIEEAERAYVDIVERDPGQLVAWFNLGALRLNRASALSARQVETGDPEAYEALERQVEAALREARPAFERTLELDPANEQVIRALMQITARLDDQEAFQRYKALLEP